MKKYKKYSRYLYRRLKAKEAILELKETLLETAISELKFYRLKTELLQNNLDEVATLLDKWVNSETIKAVIANWKEREILDTIIHNQLIIQWETSNKK